MRTCAKSRAAILVYARAPIAGAAKTRLIPELGAQDAALLQARMMQRVLLTAARAGIGPIQLWCTPSVTHAFFEQCKRDAGATLHAQHGNSLGERMHSAHDAAFGTFTRILLIGTDCPVLDESHLREAALALDDHDAALIPADDGGYVLLGLSRPCPDVFQAIDWGSNRVLEQTIARLQDAGMRHHVAPPLWDIDRPEDLRRLARCLPELLDGLGKTSVRAMR